MLVETNQYNLIIPQRADKFGERSFSVSGPAVWNLLTDYVKSLRSVDIFKSGRKPHLYHVVSNFISLTLLYTLVVGKGYAMVLYMLISSFFYIVTIKGIIHTSHMNYLLLMYYL